MKSTYCEVQIPEQYDHLADDGSVIPAYIEQREIFKDPITDDGTKKSAKGLLRVDLVGDDYVLTDQVSKEEEEKGALITVFEDGDILVDPTLAEIREKVNESVLNTLKKEKECSVSS